MNQLLAATTLDGSLAQIVANLQTLMDSFWIYIVLAMAAVVVVWGAYIGIIIMFVIAMGAPLLINGLSAWVG